MKALKTVWKYVRWPLAAILLVCAVIFLAGVNWPVSKERSDAAVAAIKAQRLTMKDVDGSNLPPVPDPKKAAATVEGIDANGNGIRDDVELAIFDRYPGDAKVRAALLQLAQSMQNTLTLVINTETWVAAVERESHARSCVFQLAPNSPQNRNDWTEFIHLSIVNTKQREHALQRSDSFATSFTVPQERECDIGFD